MALLACCLLGMFDDVREDLCLFDGVGECVVLMLFWRSQRLGQLRLV